MGVQQWVRSFWWYRASGSCRWLPFRFIPTNCAASHQRMSSFNADPPVPNVAKAVKRPWQQSFSSKPPGVGPLPTQPGVSPLPPPQKMGQKFSGASRQKQYPRLRPQTHQPLPREVFRVQQKLGCNLTSTKFQTKRSSPGTTIAAPLGGHRAKHRPQLHSPNPNGARTLLNDCREGWEALQRLSSCKRRHERTEQSGRSRHRSAAVQYVGRCRLTPLEWECLMVRGHHKTMVSTRHTEFKWKNKEKKRAESHTSRAKFGTLPNKIPNESTVRFLGVQIKGAKKKTSRCGNAHGYHLTMLLRTNAANFVSRTKMVAG